MEGNLITLIEDTRNQPGKHKAKNEYWKSQGIKVIRSKLPCGDYALLTDMSMVIDSKKDLQELTSNICGKQHERFRRECQLAQDNGIQLIILVENQREQIKGTDVWNPVITDLKELHLWKNPRLFIMKPTKEVIGHFKNGKPIFKKAQKYPSATRGITLQKACYTMEQKYGVKFLFCDKAESGKRIIEILTERKG